MVNVTNSVLISYIYLDKNIRPTLIKEEKDIVYYF